MALRLTFVVCYRNMNFSAVLIVCCKISYQDISQVTFSDIESVWRIIELRSLVVYIYDVYCNSNAGITSPAKQQEIPLTYTLTLRLYLTHIKINMHMLGNGITNVKILLNAYYFAWKEYPLCLNFKSRERVKLRKISVFCIMICCFHVAHIFKI